MTYCHLIDKKLFLQRKNCHKGSADVECHGRLT